MKMGNQLEREAGGWLEGTCIINECSDAIWMEEMSEARQYGKLTFSAETAESLKRKSLQDYDSTFNYYGFSFQRYRAREDNYDDNNVVLRGRQRNEFIDLKRDECGSRRVLR